MEELPTVHLRTHAGGRLPFLYRKMVARDPQAGAGDLVRIVDRENRFVGIGFFNPSSQIALRLLYRGPEKGYQPDLIARRLRAAVYLRRHILQLEGVTDAYRVVHAEADGLPGLVVDRLGDVLVVEFFSLGFYRRRRQLREELRRHFEGLEILMRCDPTAARREGFEPAPPEDRGAPAQVWIREHGMRYLVDLRHGHKTGFFCDQRDNRSRLAELTRSRNVLDLCTNCGAFAISAACRGEAGKVLAVDLDERALAQAARNAQANAASIEFVHADVFDFLRAEAARPPRWDVVVLDPSKLARSRDELPRARKKYLDLNRLAMGVLKNRAILLTCSCSGLISMAEFERICSLAAERAGRSYLRLGVSGAAPDHPVSPECPQSEYLKALFLSVHGR